jgi:PAS domain-containing protein
MKKDHARRDQRNESRKLRSQIARPEKLKIERERMAEALREANQFSHEIIYAASEGIAVYDRELRYLVWNQFMENLTGVSAAEVVGKHALEIFPHLRAQGIDRLLERALHGETV